jgi:hypothetical protein
MSRMYEPEAACSRLRALKTSQVAKSRRWFPKCARAPPNQHRMLRGQWVSSTTDATLPKRRLNPPLPSATPRTLTNPVASAAGSLTQNGKMNLNAMTTPTKKPKAPRPDFADAHKACRTSAEREQLAMVLSARWTSEELHEYARLFYFRNGKDYATPTSYRRAIADLGVHYRGLGYPDAKPSDYPHTWLRQFRKGGSKPLPPRREGLLQRGRGLSHHRISEEEYGWPGHTEEFSPIYSREHGRF